MREYKNVAIVLGMYAIVVLGLGLYAFTSAPAEANKATALAVPGAIAAVALIGGLMLVKAAGAKGAAGQAGKIGLLIALGLPMLVAIAVPYRAMKAGRDAALYRTKTEVFRQEVADGRKQDTPEGRKTFYASQMSPDHDKTFLVVALWGITGASAAAFVAAAVTGKVALAKGKAPPSP